MMNLKNRQTGISVYSRHDMNRQNGSRWTIANPINTYYLDMRPHIPGIPMWQ